jgi:hypothetical protein
MGAFGAAQAQKAVGVNCAARGARLATKEGFLHPESD